MIKNKTELSQAIDEKWDKVRDAMSTISNARNDLFNNVALSLSSIEGKLNFLKSDNLDGESRFSDDFSRETAEEILENVKKTRKALDEIFLDMNNGKRSLLD